MTFGYLVSSGRVTGVLELEYMPSSRGAFLILLPRGSIGAKCGYSESSGCMHQSMDSLHCTLGTAVRKSQRGT